MSGSACYEGRHVWGEGRAKACTTNSAHERLMQQEQLSSIVRLQISSVPHFASQCVSSMRAREETNQDKKKEKQARGKRKPNIKTLDVGLVVFLLFRTVVGVWLDHGLIINHEPIQTQCAVCR